MTYVSKGCKELKTKYPITSGLTAGTNKQTGRIMNLIAVGKLGVKSTVFRKEKVGL